MSVLLADVGPSWFRLGLTDAEGQVTRLHHEFAGRAEPRVGDLYRAKVHTVDQRLGGAFCDLGGAQGFLAAKGRAPRVGETVLVGVRREAIGEKACQVVPAPALRLPGATVTLRDGALSVRDGPLVARAEAADAVREQALALGRAAFAPGEVGPVRAFPPLVRAVAHVVNTSVAEVRATDPDAAAALRSWLEPLDVMVSLFDVGAVRGPLDDAEADALARTAGLAGGGRVVFDEAEALTAIDVDTAGRDARSARGAQEAVAAAMLSVIGRQASLRALGGQLVLDLPRRAFASPKVLRDRLTKALAPLGRVSIPAVTNEGIVVVIAPRAGPSLLERLTEDAEAAGKEGGGVRPGRRLRADALAAGAYRLLEGELAARRDARLRLACPARARPYLDQDAPSLAARYGARFEVDTEEGPPRVR